MTQKPITHIERIDTHLSELEQTTAHLEKARAELDSLLAPLKEHPITIQWAPTHSPPRRLTFERTAPAWTRAEYEWTGTDWRPCGNEQITDLAITPIHSLPEPATLKDRLEQTQSTTRTLTDDQ